jgi:hypothetical protein
MRFPDSNNDLLKWIERRLTQRIAKLDEMCGRNRALAFIWPNAVLQIAAHGLLPPYLGKERTKA